MSRPCTNQAHDNNRRDMRDRSHNTRPSGNGYVQNGVYHRREIVNPPNTVDNGSARSQGSSVQEGMRKVWADANAPSVIQERSNEDSHVLNDSEPEISNFANNVKASNNQGN